MEPQILFEAGFTFQKAWSILLLLLILIPTIAVRFVRQRKRDAKLAVLMCAISMVFLLAVLALVIPDQIRMYQSTVGAYQRGDYQIAEGTVEQFRPAQEYGEEESFTLGGVEFSYRDSVVQFGYHQTRAEGGVITGDGQQLRIGYTRYGRLGNVIVYIEQLP